MAYPYFMSLILTLLDPSASSETKAEEAVWEFLRYACARSVHDDGNNPIPVRNNATSSIEDAWNLILKDHYYVFTSIVHDGHGRPDILLPLVWGTSHQQRFQDLLANLQPSVGLSRWKDVVAP